jgi:hypothetical protein
MVLTPGARMEPYEVVAPIGHGGMGEADLLTSDPERRARFERGTHDRALNRPYIGQIYRFAPEDQASRVQTYDTVDGQRFVVVRTPRPPEAGIPVVKNWFEEFHRR